MLFSDFVVAQSITYRENIYYITVYPISKITINIYSVWTVFDNVLKLVNGKDDDLSNTTDRVTLYLLYRTL